MGLDPGEEYEGEHMDDESDRRNFSTDRMRDALTDIRRQARDAIEKLMALADSCTVALARAGGDGPAVGGILWTTCLAPTESGWPCLKGVEVSIHGEPTGSTTWP